MGDNCERLRLVFLGLSQTGKTAVIRRFINKTFVERYKPTVEELYYREFDLGHIKLKVDIMDTAGDFSFPAMRRLAIASAHAFVIMYSVENAESFDVAKQCFEEIREERKDFADVPMAFVGNKSDLSEKREVYKEDVSEWVFCELPKMRVKVLECSAKDDSNINEIFRTLLQLSKYPSSSAGPAGGESDQGGSKLFRRSSAYVSNRSSSSSGTSGKYSFMRRMSTTSENNSEASNTNTTSSSNKSASAATGIHSSPSSAAVHHYSSSSVAASTAGGVSSNSTISSSSSHTGGEQHHQATKPRSRSLIRRCSRKAKQQMRDAQVDNCAVS